MSEDQSRRDAIQKAFAFAAGVTAAVAATAVSRTAHAQAANEVDALRALQTAEYDAIRAYMTAEGALASDMPMDPMNSARTTVLEVVRHFRTQHDAHAARLGELITAAGGMPVDGSTIFFMPPTGFRLSIINVIRLGANKEKAAAIAYADSLKTLSTPGSAHVAAAIGGVESQHFFVLHLLAKGVVEPGPALMTMANRLVPTAFVASTGGSTTGLETVMDLAYAADMM